MRLGALRVLWGRPPGLGVQRGSRLATSNSRKRGPPTESTRARPYHVMPPYSPRKRRATAVRTADRRGGQPSTPGGRWEATATGLTPGDQTAGRASSTTPRIPRAAARTNHAGFTTSGRTQRGRNRLRGSAHPVRRESGKQLGSRRKPEPGRTRRAGGEVPSIGALTVRPMHVDTANTAMGRTRRLRGSLPTIASPDGSH